MASVSAYFSGDASAHVQLSTSILVERNALPQPAVATCTVTLRSTAIRIETKFILPNCDDVALARCAIPAFVVGWADDFEAAFLQSCKATKVKIDATEDSCTAVTRLSVRMIDYCARSARDYTFEVGLQGITNVVEAERQAKQALRELADTARSKWSDQARAELPALKQRFGRFDLPWLTRAIQYLSAR